MYPFKNFDGLKDKQSKMKIFLENPSWRIDSFGK